MSKLISLAIVAVTALLIQSSAAQTAHVVGGDFGWIVPPGGSIAYRTWAATQTFTVGDILVFNFTTGEQDVARVTKEAFDACNSTGPIFLEKTGPFNYTLDSAGEYYFIGTMDRRCTLGQKLAINVTALGPTPSPSPSSPPDAPAPVTPRGPVTYTVGDGLGWEVPPGGEVAYATWARNKVFMVGDILVFNFINETQDVAVVTKEAYETCNTTSTISILTTSPARVTLTSAGEYRFTSTYSRHCALGQKLTINVVASGPIPSPAPSSSPTAPAPVTPRSPVTYYIGDGLGWEVPPGGAVAYATWARNKDFMVGDTLVFNFINGTQDVAIVTKEAYESCNTTSTITILTTSPARVTLTTVSEHFFTSTYSRHCELGQKLAINVTGTTGTSPSPSPSIATPPTGTSTPTTSTPGSSSPSPTAGGPATAPPPSSSAPPRVIYGFSLITLLSTIFLAVFH
ncbi:hypothetical protein CDL15_Pgr015353 [Punica granatum]|uniref:Phytocyanin domain-containing protein n=1 Tax=Punica granatum TaxID=22663 RepID=A0A218W0D4_PUNGR|nr:hypothetical protein CDL15_Pgr015353 [Punica granatum]